MLKCCCYFICTSPSNTPKAQPNKRVKGVKQMKRKSLGRVEDFANKVRQMPAISKFRNAARKWQFCLRFKPTQYTQPTQYDNDTFLTWFNKRKMWIYNDYLQWLQHWNLEQPTEINFKMHSTMSKLWTGKFLTVRESRIAFPKALNLRFDSLQLKQNISNNLTDFHKSVLGISSDQQQRKTVFYF